MAGKLVEEAEALLIMSEFAKAERISKKALEELPKANTSDTDLQSRACSIHLQALFEQGRCAALYLYSLLCIGNTYLLHGAGSF